MYRAPLQDRYKSAVAVTAFHALLGYAFLTGLGADFAGAVDEQLKMFDVPPLVPPPEPVQPSRELANERAERVKPAPKEPEGAAAPPNIKSRPTEIVAPPRTMKLDVPTPVVAAPIAGPGAAATSGNAAVIGPGTGAGGVGTGTGSGRSGDGGGGGGGAGLARGPELLRADVRDYDYPRRAWDAGIEGRVGMRFLITKQGRIGRCIVTHSSGHPGLDRDTCRVMEKRLLHAPARDAYGRPVAGWTEGWQEWRRLQHPDRWVEADIPEDE